MILDDMCAYCKNYFVDESYSGTYTIENGTVSLPFLQYGQYYRIVGSIFNDGVHQYPNSDLTDENFTGTIQAMAIPPAFLRLASEIEGYELNSLSTISPYTSESWGGYSYTKSTETNGAPITWQTLFSKRLNRWRKL